MYADNNQNDKIYDQASGEWIDNPNSTLELLRDQQALVQDLRNFYEDGQTKDILKGREDIINYNDFLETFKNTDEYKDLAQLLLINDEFSGGTKDVTISMWGKEITIPGNSLKDKSATIPISTIKKLYPNTYKSKVNYLTGKDVKIKLADLQEGGKFEDLEKHLTEKPTTGINELQIDDKTPKGRTYRNNLIEFRRNGVIDPFDPKWQKLLDAYDPKLKEGLTEDQQKFANTHVKDFHMRLQGPNFTGDFNPSGKVTMRTKTVNGKPELFYVFDGYYDLDQDALNSLFHPDLQYHGDLTNMLNPEDYRNIDYDFWNKATFGLVDADDPLFELFLKGTGDSDHLADLFSLSPNVNKISEDNKQPLFRINATYERPVGDLGGIEFNTKHSKLGTDVAAENEKLWQRIRTDKQRLHLSKKYDEKNAEIFDGKVQYMRDYWNGFFVKPIRNTKNIDTRKDHVEKMFMSEGTAGSPKGPMKILNETYGTTSTDPIYKSMSDLLTKYQTSIYEYINHFEDKGADNPSIKQNYEAALTNMGLLSTMLNPQYWGGDKPLTNDQIKYVMRKHLQDSGKVFDENLYKVDSEKTNLFLGIQKGKVVNKNALREASAEYYGDTDKFTRVSPNNIPSNVKISNDAYAPYLSNKSYTAFMNLQKLEIVK